MSIDLVLPRGTPVAMQGSDVSSCRRFVKLMRHYGTHVVACIAADGDSDAEGDARVFRQWGEARTATSAEVCVSIAPARQAADTAQAAAEAGFRMIVSLGTGVPVHDMMRVSRRIHEIGATWIGAASSGVARPSAGLMLGGIPASSLHPGDVAVITTCGGLGAEAGLKLGEAGLGQSLYVDVGGDPVKGTRMAALPGVLAADEATRAVVLLGSADGMDETEFSTEIKRLSFPKPVLAYIAGHADSARAGAVARKSAALAAAGVTVYNSLGALVAALKASA